MIMEFIDSKYIENRFQSLIARADNFLHDDQLSADWKWLPSPPLYALFNPVIEAIRDNSKANGYEKIFIYPLSDNLITNTSLITEWPATITEFPGLVRKIGTYMSALIFDDSSDWVLLVDPDEIIFLGAKTAIIRRLEISIDDIRKSILAEAPDFAYPRPNHLEVIPIDFLFKKCGYYKE